MLATQSKADVPGFQIPSLALHLLVPPALGQSPDPTPLQCASVEGMN